MTDAAEKEPTDRENALPSEESERPSGDPGLSLDELSNAFEEMLQQGEDPYSGQDSAQDDSTPADPLVDALPPMNVQGDDDPCEITPRSILESILFVGQPDGGPISCDAVAALMRGVRPAEIPDLVGQLNEAYQRDGCPYHIESVGPGFRLVLRSQFNSIRNKFHGRMRDARLSQAAIDVLALVAYHQPLTSVRVSKLRGTPSGSILSQLVRRQLLRVERPEKKSQKHQYHTTPRFLELFGLQSLDELPRPQDVEKK